jgi:hypothetical protein
MECAGDPMVPFIVPDTATFSMPHSKRVVNSHEREEAICAGHSQCVLLRCQVEPTAELRMDKRA